MKNEPNHSRRLAAILAADIAGYSALVGADEEGAVQALKGHQAVVLPMVGQHGGRVIDIAGDGIMAEFSSVLAALKCALAIQATMAERNAQVPLAKRLQFRIGINLGDVIFDETRIYGDGINVAARLEGLAEPGGISVSSNVHEQSLGKVDCAFEDIGEQALKNIARPVRVYRVRSKVVVKPDAGSPMLTLPDKPSIAVLPFTNMSGDPEQEYFSDGIAEDILTELSRLRWLFVTARNSSFTYKGKAVDVKQVSRELGVRYVLEGSVRKAGNRVRVTGQLIDATTGNHVWAERYDRDIADVFAVQDEITKSVTSAIGPAISKAEQQKAIRASPETLSAWDAYHRGIWHLSQHELDELNLSRKFLQIAIDLNPDLAPAYTALSIVYTRAAHMFGLYPISEGIIKAEPVARKAVAVDGNDANARARLAYVLLSKGDHEGAIDEAQRSLSINANCADAFAVKGSALAFSGRGREGREAIRQYLKMSPLDPDRPIRHAQLVGSYYLDRDYETAVSMSRQVIRQFPKYPHSYRWLIAALGQLGVLAKDSEDLRDILKNAPASFRTYIEQRPPMLRVADHEHMLEGIRKAGWQV